MANTFHDSNHIPVLLATSSADGVTPVLVWADPTTHRLLTTSSTTTVYTETPSGAINSSNKTYTVLHTINNVFSFAINGMYIHPSEYSTSGSTITFVTALDSSLSGTSFTIVYQ